MCSNGVYLHEGFSVAPAPWSILTKGRLFVRTAMSKARKPSLLALQKNKKNKKQKQINEWIIQIWLLFFLCFNLPCLGTKKIIMDYRCENGSFPKSSICVRFSNPPLAETGVNPGTRSWKMHSSGRVRRQKAIGAIYFPKKWSSDSITCFRFDNFKPWLESDIFKCISWLNGLFFGCDNLGFRKERIVACLMAPMSSLNSPVLFLLHTYSPWKI